MKTKSSFKTIAKKWALCLLCFCFALIPFMTTGCVSVGGNWMEDLNEQLENGEITQEEYDDLIKEYSGGVELEGIKVLRRPADYDFDNAAVDKDQKPIADYYENFSITIFQELENIYGVVNGDTQDKEINMNGVLVNLKEEFFSLFEILDFIKPSEGTEDLKNLFHGNGDNSEDKMKYFYDGLRYQITSEVGMSNGPTNDPSDDYIVTDPNDDIHYYTVTADTSKGWNWVQNNQAFGVETVTSFLSNSTYTKNEFKANFPLVDSEKNEIINKYDKDIFIYSILKPEYEALTTYLSSFTSSTNEDLQTALTYAIYCIVLGLEPNDCGWVENYNLTAGSEFVVKGYENEYETDPMNTLKQRVVDSKTSAKKALADVKAKFEKVGAYVGLTTNDKKNISDFILDQVIGEKAQVYGKQDLFYEDVVPAVVEYCGMLTTIGKAPGEEDNESTVVGDTFIASEIVDYPSTTFFLSQEADPYSHIGSHEYQSMLIMPKADINLTDVWLDFRYDAKDENGNIIDESNLPHNERKSITIDVGVRYWNGTGFLPEQVKTITVVNGVVQPGEINTTVEFELETDMAGEPVGFGQPAFVKPFDQNIPFFASGNEKVVNPLNGQSPFRDYYKVHQTSSYGGIGILNEKKFVDIPFFEITFDVKRGDINEALLNNYDFKVAFSNFYNK